MAIDWQKFYRTLDRLKVNIPEPDRSDPAQIDHIMRLLARVNNHRQTLDNTQRKIERILGATKNDIEIVGEQLRISRAEVMHEGDQLAHCRNKEERTAQIDLLTRGTAAKLAVLKAKRQQLEHALSSVESTHNTLKAAKETLNGIKTILLTEMENLR